MQVMCNYSYWTSYERLDFSLEEISEGLLYDPRDIQRFNENDDYAMMFVQHGQYGTTFDEKRALKIFNDAMVWRKQNNIYGW